MTSAGIEPTTYENTKIKKMTSAGIELVTYEKQKIKKMTSEGIEPRPSTHTKIKKDLRRNRTPHLKPENPITNSHCAKNTFEKIKHVLP